MSDTFTAQELADFYQKVADGRQVQYRPYTKAPWRSQETPNGPSLKCRDDNWRIKPTKKVIDLSVLIDSQIDCEFTDANEAGIFISKVIKQSRRISLALPEYRYYDVDGDTWNRCRPRMNHKHAWQGGACPLPEGFKVKVWWRTGGEGDAEMMLRHLDLRWSNEKRQSDIIAFEVLGVADGYVMPWEQDND